MLVGVAFVFSATNGQRVGRQFALAQTDSGSFARLCGTASALGRSGVVPGGLSHPGRAGPSWLIGARSCCWRPFRVVRHGARRRAALVRPSAFFSLQPSEFAKLAFILAMAHFLSRPQDELRSAELIFWKALGLLVLAVCSGHEGAGPRVPRSSFIPRHRHDARGRRAAALSVAADWARLGVMASLIAGGRAVRAAQWQIKLEEYQRTGCSFTFGQDFAPPMPRRAEGAAKPAAAAGEILPRPSRR